MKKVNLISVSARIALMLAACIGAYLLRDALGGIVSLILLLPALAILVQLVIWGANWVKTENVSELGLHIVRFWVILTALALSVFTMLTIDYSNQHDRSIATELEQTVLAGSYYLRGQLSESAAPAKADLTDLDSALDSVLLDNGNNSERDAIIYLFASADHALLESTGFVAVSDTVIAAATDDALLEKGADTSVSISSSDLSAGESTHAGGDYISAYCPLYTENGKFVGYLEICEQQSFSSFIFRYANLELFLSVAALIALFCFLFYGIMQLVDIVLRPRRFDPTRVLPFGRESARPLMFTITLAFAYPILPLVFSAQQTDILPSDTIFGYIIDKFLPVAVYLAGACVGLIVGIFPKNKLKAIPAVIGLAVSLAASAASMFIGGTYIDCALLAVSGLGIGIAYRIGSRYKEHADSIYGVDSYAYLCPCLGGIAGLILGVVCSSYGLVSDILGCALIALAELVCVLMLRDVNFTADDGMNGKRKLRGTHGSLIAILMPGTACAFLWVYGAHFLYHTCEQSLLAVSACVAAPLIAFCFGNRLRMVTRASQRAVIIIGGLLAALSFLPLAILETTAGAVFSTMLVCLSVIFSSSAMYSILQPAEMKKAASFLRILIVPAIAVFGYLAASTILPGELLRADIWLYICAALTAALSLVFALVSRFPDRDEDEDMTVEEPQMTPSAAVQPAIAQPVMEALPEAKPEPVAEPETKSAPEPVAEPVPEPEPAPETTPVQVPEPEPVTLPGPAAQETPAAPAAEDEIIIELSDETLS